MAPVMMESLDTAKRIVTTLAGYRGITLTDAQVEELAERQRRNQYRFDLDRANRPFVLRQAHPFRAVV